MGLGNDNIKWSKLQDTQLGVSKTYAIYQKIKQGALGPGECYWGYISIFENTLES